MSQLLFPLPETKPAVIRALILDDLAGFVFWPQVKHEHNPNTALHPRQERRKHLAEPEHITHFGDNL